MQAHYGELAALLTAVAWTVTAMAFEAAGKRVGSLSVNLIRLVMAFLILTIFNFFTRGYAFPSDATSYQWFWLGLSGIVGFVLGDLFLFQAFVLISARISMLIMSLVPPITALLGWIILGEKLTFLNWIGMMITLVGIAIVILKRSEESKTNTKSRKISTQYSFKGILWAFGGALGQSIGLILSKKGMGEYNAFAATQIRIIIAIIGFVILFFILKRWQKVFQALRNKIAMTNISIGSFFGPFIGVSFSLIAVKYTSTGVAATLMAIVPVLLIPPSILLKKEKVTWKEITGALIAVLGVATFFLKGF